MHFSPGISVERIGTILRLALILFLVFPESDANAQTEIEVIKDTYVYKDTLKLDFYSSQRLGEAVTEKRPLVVLVHGGGFSGGKRDGTGESEFCRKMAQKGYAVASISYRLTRKGESFGCDCPAETKISTFVKAGEDLSDALSYLIDRVEEFAFDRTGIVLAGSSAGAETVLNAAFMTGHRNFKSIKKREIAGVISFAGAMVNSTYINEDNAVPALFFHGKKDKLVPYSTAPHHYCPTRADGYLMLDGPETIASRLGTLGKANILAFDPEGGHDWANKGYKETELVHHFIENIIRQGGFEQTLLRLDTN